MYIGTGTSPTLAGSFDVLLNGSPSGEFQINSDAAITPLSAPFGAALLIAGNTFFTAVRPMRVKAVIARLNAANALAATLTVVKVASGTAVTGGTSLTSNSVDCAGTPNTNQTLTLSATAADLELAAGDSLGFVGTGTLVAGQGDVTVHVFPH